MEVSHHAQQQQMLLPVRTSITSTPAYIYIYVRFSHEATTRYTVPRVKNNP